MGALLPLFEKAHLKALQERREWLLEELEKLPPHSRKRPGVEHLLHATTARIFMTERDLDRPPLNARQR